MSALVFLGIAVVLSLAGCLVLWLRMRQPRSMDAHIRDFARELDALAPGSPIDRRMRAHRPDRPERPLPPERLRPPDEERRPG